MITKEELADLREGDAVELRDSRWGGVTISGPVRLTGMGLCVGPLLIVGPDGREPYDPDGPIERSLTVVSRAPRPLYVNHDRAEPYPGDVVRDADCDYPDDQRTWMYDDTRLPWFCGFMGENYGRINLPDRLRLLVDGATGQVVQP